MEISLFDLSMSRTFSLWLESRFFFKPVEISIQLAQLAVKLLDQFLPVLIMALSLIRKKINQPLGGRRFPIPDLTGMNLVLTGQLCRCFDVFCSLIASRATLALNDGVCFLLKFSTWFSLILLPSVT